MWQSNLLIIMYATLASFGLEIIPKASLTSEMSNRARHFGRLVIGSGTKPISNKNKESKSTTPQTVLEDNEGYQSDQSASTAWHEMVKSKLKQLNPTVYCGGDAMTLHLQGNVMPHFMIDGGDGPVPLTKVPADCGLSVSKGPTDVGFTVHYQGCHVTQQGDGHVLPLRLWGMPMKLSCPSAPYTLPTVFCLASDMITKISCTSADVLKLKVNGKWEPFVSASSKCGITTEAQTDGMVITAPYQNSCWQIKGGEKLLSIMYANEELIFSCPHSQDPHPNGHVRVVSFQSHESSIIPSTDTGTGLSSNPEQSITYPFGHIYYRDAWAIPTGTSTDLSVTSSLTTNAPVTVSTSKPVDMHQFPHMYYPFGPMSYDKPMPYGYPWAFPAKVPITAPTAGATTISPVTAAQTSATPAATVASNLQQSLNRMYYPFGPMQYNHKPRSYGYPWVFPVKVPTAAPTTTVTAPQTTAKSTTVASNPKQSVYSFNQIYYPYHHKLRPYDYPWAFLAKGPTTAPTTTAPSTTTAPTVPTSNTFAYNPKQSVYSFNHLYYPYGPMPYHRNPMPYSFPWAFPINVPTTASTTAETTQQTPPTTTTTTVNNPQHSGYSFNRMYHPYGPIPHYRKPMYYGYPWSFPTKVPASNPTENIAASTTKMATTIQTIATALINVTNDTQHPFSRMHYQFGPMYCHQRPSNYIAYPWGFPEKVPISVPTTIADTRSTTGATNSEQSVYPFNLYSLFNPMNYQYKTTNLHYPWALPANAPATSSTVVPITTAPTTTTTSPQIHPFWPKYFGNHLPSRIESTSKKF